MSQSGMSASSSSTSPGLEVSGAAPADEPDPAVVEWLRRLVMAGPGGPEQGSPARLGLFGQAIVSPEQIAQALRAAGHVDRRRRDLPGEVTMVAVLNLALYSGEGYDAVLARTVSAYDLT